MELSQEILMETGLNALGYIIVSILSIMTYSMFKGKNRSVALNKSQSVIGNNSACEKENLKNKEVSNNANFISFGASRNTNNTNNVSETTNTNTTRRDRPQIIRIARDMIKAGATVKNIMSVLPISEAELSILSMTNK